jgi:biopolymer transport protein ExbB/TolQ
MIVFLQKGGVVLWLLVAISAYAVALIIERLLYFKQISIDETKLYTRTDLAGLSALINKTGFAVSGKFEYAFQFRFDRNVSPDHPQQRSYRMALFVPSHLSKWPHLSFFSIESP